jgi:hypothetical protein
MVALRLEGALASRAGHAPRCMGRSASLIAGAAFSDPRLRSIPQGLRGDTAYRPPATPAASAQTAPA